MSSWADTQDQLTQEHFEIIEIQLPVVEGVCNFDGGQGFGTDRTCEEPVNATAVYKFANVDAPLIPFDNTVFAGTDIYRCLSSVTESPTKLKPGDGLAGRGTISLKFTDFIGDPNPNAPGVTDDVKLQGTFFGKLAARQNLVNAVVTIKLYRRQFGSDDIDLAGGFISRVYIVESLKNDGKGSWMIAGKDPLSFVNFDEVEWPPSLDYSLTGSIVGSRDIPVSQNAVIIANDVIRIESELMSVDSTSNMGTPTAQLRVQVRGSSIARTEVLTRTREEVHNIGDEVFLCDISDNERIDDFLQRMLIEAGVDPAYIPIADWNAEIDEWLSGYTINTIWYKTESIGKIITGVLNDYLLDMWFDQTSKTIKLSAINVWKQASRVLTEGVEIDYNTIKLTPVPELRASRALVVYDKPDLARPDDLEWFAKASIYRDSTLEEPAEYGKPKDKRFDLSRILAKDPADLLVQRYVSRFGRMPNNFTWTTQERNLIFDVGDIVSMITGEVQSFDGSTSQAVRAQVTSIKPKYTGGREYQCSALTFESAIGSVPGQPPAGSFVLVGNLTEVNLYIQAGAPNIAVDVTFVFDGATASSTSIDIAAIEAGAFKTGSTITIIMINGTDWQGKGGNGGDGVYYGLSTVAGAGKNGGLCYDAQGIQTAIYFSGAAPQGYTADGYLRAPGGGGGGARGNFIVTDAMGGSGGAGINVGFGGFGSGGLEGQDGTTAGTGGAAVASGGAGGNWGLAGDASPLAGDEGGAGGIAGKGIITGGATVTTYGDDAARFINGIGDAVVPGVVQIDPIRSAAEIYLETYSIYDVNQLPLTLWANEGNAGTAGDMTVIDGDPFNGALRVILNPATGLKMVNSSNIINRLGLAVPLPDYTQEFTVFIIFNTPDFVPDQVLLSNGSTSQFAVGVTTGGDVFIDSGMGTTNIAAGLTVDDNHVLSIRFDGGSSAIWIDGEPKELINVGTNDLKSISLFNKGGAGGLVGFTGNIGDFAIVIDPLTDLKTEEIHNEFMDRWL